MFVLPELSNPYSNYSPYIDAQTMEIHHQKHHAGYVKKINQACVDADIDCNRIEDIFENIEEMSPAIRNNAGGHYNHTVFWTILNTTMTTPSSKLHAKITETFGGLEDFKAEFTKAALGVFGSGWVWLVSDTEGNISITTTHNQDNPLMSDINTGYPILGIDLWEHAYYLNYQNKRVEYMNNIWALVDWDQISFRYDQRPEMNDLS